MLTQIMITQRKQNIVKAAIDKQILHAKITTVRGARWLGTWDTRTAWTPTATRLPHALPR